MCIICPSIHPYPSIYPSSTAFSPPRFLEGVLSPRPGFVGDADLPDLNGEGDEVHGTWNGFTSLDLICLCNEILICYTFIWIID